uniref:Uncharacterized protein n=1 Tax=Anguilla anguilla TaxID=7936 RepID=A0A0E9RPL2_ANGAN
MVLLNMIVMVLRNLIKCNGLVFSLAEMFFQAMNAQTFFFF